MGGVEQRKFPRIEANAYVDYTGDEVLLYHAIENISLGGLSIIAPTVEKVGKTVQLMLNFPDSETNLECIGEVVWSHEGEEGRMGIKFLNLTNEQKNSLKEFLGQIDTFYAEMR